MRDSPQRRGDFSRSDGTKQCRDQRKSRACELASILDSGSMPSSIPARPNIPWRNKLGPSKKRLPVITGDPEVQVVNNDNSLAWLRPQPKFTNRKRRDRTGGKNEYW